MSKSISSIDGKPLSLDQYPAKAYLIVNIATQCGYTKQLKGLEDLYLKYKDQGLVVLGIPSNDFGGQTPEKDSEVLKFCKVNYGVTFPLTEKVSVKGENTHPFVKELLNQEQSPKDIQWNFEKFLLNSKGERVARFLSAVTPDSPEIQSAIEKQIQP